MNKRDISICKRYAESNKTSLWYAYEKASSKKQEAWEYCQQLCKERNGKGLKIIGANSYNFSAGFIYEEPKDVRHLMYITKEDDRSILLGNEFKLWPKVLTDQIYS